MHIRRPVAALVTALALAGGGGMLTGCSNGGDSNTGTPRDQVTKSSTSPSNASMGNLPTDSNRVTSSSTP